MDTLESVARGVGGLVAVLAVVWAATRVLRSRIGRGGESALRVSQRVGLGRRSGVAVVEAGTRRFLVGVGDAQVSLLAELREVPAVPAARPAGTGRSGEEPAAVTVRRVPGPRQATVDAGTSGSAPRSLGGLVERARERTLRR